MRKFIRCPVPVKPGPAHSEMLLNFNLSAFFIIVAVTLFGALLGVLGALTAVPLAAVIQIFVQELKWSRPPTLR